MTFERPFALALLAAVPLAWWLHRRRSGAPVVRVASLLAFRDAGAASPSAAPRRAIDPPLAMTLCAMALLALAAAGPTFGTSAPAAFYVVVDRSVSMTARTCDAATRADAVLREVAPDANAARHDLANADGTDGLPASLAPHLTAARAEGFPGVVLVTDADVAAMPGVAIVGPSAGVNANVSIASAVLDGDEAIVALRNHGAKDVTVRLGSGGVVRDVAVPGGGVGTARFAAPPQGEKAMGQFTGRRRGPSTAYEIVAPPDGLAADDRLVVERRGGAGRVAADGDRHPRLAAALRATDAAIGGTGPWDLAMRYGMSIIPPDREPLLVVAPGRKVSTGDLPAPIRSAPQAGPETLRGDEIVGRGGFADVLPAPGTTLVARERLIGGEAIWSDTRGVLAARYGDLLVLAVDPEDPRSDWHRDPSFPAFVAAALDALTDGPDRLEPVSAVPASESDVVHEPPKTSSPDEVRAVVRPAGPEPNAMRPARWFALAAAALLGAAAFLRRA